MSFISLVFGQVEGLTRPQVLRSNRTWPMQLLRKDAVAPSGIRIVVILADRLNVVQRLLAWGRICMEVVAVYSTLVGSARRMVRRRSTN